MLKNTILTAALAFAGFAATADAHPVPAPAPILPARGIPAPRYEVLVKHFRHWDSKGVFCHRDEARQLARRLRHRGYEVILRRI